MVQNELQCVDLVPRIFVASKQHRPRLVKDWNDNRHVGQRLEVVVELTAGRGSYVWRSTIDWNGVTARHVELIFIELNFRLSRELIGNDMQQSIGDGGRAIGGRRRPILFIEGRKVLKTNEKKYD